ncbi:MAG TPA: MaoC family dehydratase N-terminal domain-containing protein [Mycobacteriales bacterium]|nr:MaoC family dehydratase N-terminal domain-containing protein [Mycobacteriales bacterium]
MPEHAETRAATVDPFPVAALAALFDDGLPAPAAGDPLPAYWHVAACATPPPTGALGPDGHPSQALLAAPPGLPRRMFAGGELEIRRPATIGGRLEVHSAVIATEDKAGRSGPLHFVTAEHNYIDAAGEPVMRELQRVVYRPADDRQRAATAPALGPPGRVLVHHGGLAATLRADATALQRFSAATSNPHRIHYDHPYVTQVEGYPGLIVHGPLLLLALLELLRLAEPESQVIKVTFAARAPVFAGDAVDLVGTRQADVVTLQARNGDEVAMRVEARLSFS